MEKGSLGRRGVVGVVTMTKRLLVFRGKSTVTPSVTAQGDTNPSDATACADCILPAPEIPVQCTVRTYMLLSNELIIHHCSIDLGHIIAYSLQV